MAADVTVAIFSPNRRSKMPIASTAGGVLEMHVLGLFLEQQAANDWRRLLCLNLAKAVSS